MLRKEELTPCALEFFETLKAELPTKIPERLCSNRQVVSRGSYNNLFLFCITLQHLCRLTFRLPSG